MLHRTDGGSHGGLSPSRLSMLVAAALAVVLTNAANAAGGTLQPPQAGPSQVPRFPSALRQAATPEQLEAARGIEMLLADQLIQEMRKSVPENEFVPLTQGEKIFRQMLDSEYAKVMSEAGALGISDLVLAEMMGKR